jgi:Flp pilus assembly protein TadG
MRNIKGQAIVELALILPLLFVLIFGIVDFGRVMYMKNSLNNAARAGARVAAVTASLSPKSGSVFGATSEPALTIKNSLSQEIPSDDSVQYELKIVNTTAVPPAPISATTTASAGYQVHVKVTWPNYKTITPLYKFLALSDTSLTITGESSMRYE